MDTIGIYEYNSKDLIGHGAFAVVYKGRVKMVRFIFGFLFLVVKSFGCTSKQRVSNFNDLLDGKNGLLKIFGTNYIFPLFLR